MTSRRRLNGSGGSIDGRVVGHSMFLTDLAGSNPATAELDRMLVADEQGYVLGRIGFAVSLFFRGGAQIGNRLLLCSILREYDTFFGERLTHFQKVDANRLSPIEGRGYLDYFEAQARALPDDEPMDAAVYGYPGGDIIDEPTSISMLFTATGPLPLRPQGLSNVCVYFPAAFIVERGYGFLRDCALRWSQALGVLQGSAGFSVVFEHGIFGGGGASRAALPFMKRFPGLDYTDPGHFVVESSKSDGQRIQSINWLTILSNELAARVGGTDGLSEKLGSSCPIHRYPGGIVIQAGDQPQLGDVNRGLVLVDYRRVAQALKPIRFEAYRRGLFVLGEPFDQMDETLKWIRRFD